MIWKEYQRSLNSNSSGTDWNFADYIDGDWDTDVKINMLNRQDAQYSGVSIAKIENLLK